jgi:ABC-type nitrate/sulfonate/bicarbonate transport system substrate-binding protein
VLKNKKEYNMKRLLMASIILIFLVGLLGSGCLTQAQDASNNKQKTEDNTTTVIKYPKTQWYDSVYIADKKGFFAEQNITIQYVGEIPTAQIVPAVAGGSIDFGLRHTPVVILARAQGYPLKIVASGTQSLPDYPHMRYIIRKNSSIKSPRDLIGKKVAIDSFGACSEFVTKEYLGMNNIEGKPQFVELPDAQQEQSLEQGIIDVAIIHAPYSKKAVSNPALKEFTNDYKIDKGASGMCPYFTNENFIKKNPGVVRGFVTAVAKASDWTKDHPDEANKIVAEKLGIKVEQVEPWAYYEHQLIKKDAVEWWLNFLEKDGDLKPGEVKVEDFYTNEFNPNK